MKNILFILSFLLIVGCNNKYNLIMERGIQYYEWNMLEEAIFEFKQITHSLGIKAATLDYSKIKLLSRAHHNLAVTYAKKKWYTDAVAEAKKAFALYPSDENKKVLELIKTKLISKQDSTKKSIL